MISKAELRDIIVDEKWALLKPRIDLAQAQLEIEDLEMQIACPDYYDERTEISPTLHGQLSDIQMKSDNADKLIHELGAIQAFATGVFLCLFSPIFLITLIMLLSII